MVVSRGPHPEDAEAFGPTAAALLRRAAEEVCWLLERGWPMATAASVVGNHHQLVERQRIALTRSCAAPSVVRARHSRRQPADALRGGAVQIDGFNLLITLEVALGGGVLLRGRDGTFRDLAGLRGSYHVIESTRAAVDKVHDALATSAPDSVEWWLDAPVSNSGRLLALIEDKAKDRPWRTRVHLVSDADTELVGRELVVSADALVIDRAASWHDLVSRVVDEQLPDAWIVSLENDEPAPAG